ncbi:MAG: hypothetical protein ACK48N_09785, partial [Planctomyces sp.]
ELRTPLEQRASQPGLGDRGNQRVWMRQVIAVQKRETELTAQVVEVSTVLGACEPTGANDERQTWSAEFRREPPGGSIGLSSRTVDCFIEPEARLDLLDCVWTGITADQNHFQVDQRAADLLFFVFVHGQTPQSWV